MKYLLALPAGVIIAGVILAVINYGSILAVGAL